MNEPRDGARERQIEDKRAKSRGNAGATLYLAGPVGQKGDDVFRIGPADRLTGGM